MKAILILFATVALALAIGPWVGGALFWICKGWLIPYYEWVADLFIKG